MKKPTNLRAAIGELAACLRTEAECYEQVCTEQMHRAARNYMVNASEEHKATWMAAVWHGRSVQAVRSAERMEQLLAEYELKGETSGKA